MTKFKPYLEGETMNNQEVADKLLHVAKAIEEADRRTFDMSTWYDPMVGEMFDIKKAVEQPLQHGAIHCGTSGCIAGWICSEFLPEGEKVQNYAVSTRAVELIGANGALSEELREMFSEGDWWAERGFPFDDRETNIDYITQEAAVAELRLMAKVVLEGAYD
jgi:hypothetical protein